MKSMLKPDSNISPNYQNYQNISLLMGAAYHLLASMMMIRSVALRFEMKFGLPGFLVSHRKTKTLEHIKKTSNKVIFTTIKKHT